MTNLNNLTKYELIDIIADKMIETHNYKNSDIESKLIIRNALKRSPKFALILDIKNKCWLTV